MKEQRLDIHQHITDRIVATIERGAGDFRLPWHRSTGSIVRPVIPGGGNRERHDVDVAIGLFPCDILLGGLSFRRL
jgi:antirestriction protein ArdC